MANEDAEDNPRVASLLLRRAADLFATRLSSGSQAFTLAGRAVSLWPAESSNAVRLEELAQPLGRSADVVALYQKVIDDAYDAATARTYQARRATLLAEVLGRVDEAVEALQQLVEIAPKDMDAHRMLQSVLRKHKRHKDLLLALERELEAGSPDALAVRKEIATVWEKGLRNAFEAKDAWKRVLKAAPDDADARAALERMEAKRSSDDLDEGPLAAEPVDDISSREILAPPPGERGADAVESLDADALQDSSSREIAAPPPGDRAGEAVESLDADALRDASSREIVAPPPGEFSASTAPDVHDRDGPTGTFAAPGAAGTHESAAARDATEEFEAPQTATRLKPGDDFAPAETNPAAPLHAPLAQGATPRSDHHADEGATGTFRRGSGAGPDEPTSERLAPDALDDLESLEAHDRAEALIEDAEPVEEAEPEEIEPEEISPDDEVHSLDDLAALASPPTGERPSAAPSRPGSRPPPPPPTSRPPPPPPRTSRPPPPPTSGSRPPPRKP
jgi:tetratricopeptide (TPR) repeat protein